MENRGRLMNVLTAAGLDLQSTDPRGYNLLLDAIDHGDLAYLKRLKGNSINLSGKCHPGRTVLHVLASQVIDHDTSGQRLQCLWFFLDEGLTPNDQDY